MSLNFWQIIGLLIVGSLITCWGFICCGIRDHIGEALNDYKQQSDPEQETENND